VQHDGIERGEFARIALAIGQEEEWELGDGWPGPRVFEDYSEVRKKGFSPLLLPQTWRKDSANKGLRLC